MRHLIAALCFALAAGPAMAADKAEKSEKKAVAEKSAKKEPSAKQKAQQDKMRDCSAQAKTKSLKGDERKAFMSECMKG